MATRAGIVVCPFCDAHLQDTKQEYIFCQFCGKNFKRGTIAKEKEEELRRNMVLDLSDSVQKMKTVSYIGMMFGALFIILGLPWLFSEIFEVTEILLMLIFFINGGVWIGLGVYYWSKLEETQSKLFDLTGGRTVFEY